MQTPNTQEDLDRAKIAICGMRDIDPDSKGYKSLQNKQEIRDRIEHHKEDLALKNDEFELHGVNFTELPYQSEKQKAQTAAANKKSSFGKFIV